MTFVVGVLTRNRLCEVPRAGFRNAVFHKKSAGLLRRGTNALERNATSACSHVLHRNPATYMHFVSDQINSWMKDSPALVPLKTTFRR